MMLKILSDEMVKEIIKYGEYLDEGVTRKVVMYKDRIFKIEIEENGCNEREVWLYRNYGEEFNFLNKIYSFSEDYKVIEVEKLDCEKIVVAVEEYQYENKYELPIYMEEAIDLFPWIKDTIDFEISLVTDFIQMNDLDPTEVLLPFQWGIDKNGCLKLTDYAN